MAKTLGLRTSKAADLSSGSVCVLLGALALMLSRGRDGFDKGLFIGGTVALMVFGGYLLGSALRARNDTAPDVDGERKDDLWLPSRDQP